MKYALKKVRRIILAHIATDKHMCTLNDLTTVKISNSADTIEANGSDGSKLAVFDTKKTSQVTATNGAIESGMLVAQSGGTEQIIANGTGIRYRETITLTSTTSITLKHKASGTAGNEVKYIYRADSNGNPSTVDKDVYTQSATASTTAFAYAPDTKVLTLPTSGFAIGDVVIVDYYPTFSNYKEIDNDSDKFGVNAKVIIDGWFTDLCTKEDVPLQFVCRSGKVAGKFDLEFGDKCAVQDITIDCNSSACLTDGKNLWKMYTYDEDNITA